MTEENTSQNSNNATRKELLAPLATYGVIAIAIVAVIITTAIMLNKQLNTIEQDVATLESELAEKNIAAADEVVTTEDAAAQVLPTEVATGETVVNDDTPAVAEVIADPDTTQSASAADIQTGTDTTTVQPVSAASSDTVSKDTENVSTIATATDTENVIAEVSESTADVSKESFVAERNAFIAEMKAMMKQRMSEQNAIMKQRDAKHLESFKANLDRQIDVLQQQLLRTQKMIADVQKRNQSVYEMQATSMEEHQQRRDSLLNRI